MRLPTHYTHSVDALYPQRDAASLRPVSLSTLVATRPTHNRASRQVHWRSVNGRETSGEQMQPELRPRVAYCGFSDTANVGDYALYRANLHLFPRLHLVSGQDPAAGVSLFGGGTLYPYCLRYNMFPKRPLRVAIGLGVEDPEFSGRFGPLTLLAMHLQRFRVFGVRGPRSHQILKRHGIRSTVTGDTALALSRPPSTAPRPASVGISLVGEAMTRQGDRTRTGVLVEGFCRKAMAEGCEIVLAPFCREDLPWAQDLQRRLDGRPRLLDFWSPEIGEDLDLFLTELSRLGFMVAERLHAGVMAAALKVPFVLLPYKPKCLDFTESLDPGLSLAYDDCSVEALWGRTSEGLRTPEELTSRFAPRVDEFSACLRETAARIEGVVLDAAGE
jgi:hypothetical protein